MKIKTPAQLAFFTERVFAKPLAGKARLLATFRQYDDQLQRLTEEVEAAEAVQFYDADDWDALCEEQERLLALLGESSQALAPYVKDWWLQA